MISADVGYDPMLDSSPLYSNGMPVQGFELFVPSVAEEAATMSDYASSDAARDYGEQQAIFGLDPSDPANFTPDRTPESSLAASCSTQGWQDLQSQSSSMHPASTAIGELPADRLMRNGEQGVQQSVHVFQEETAPSNFEQWATGLGQTQPADYGQQHQQPTYYGQPQSTDYGQPQPTDYGQQQPTDYGQQQPTDYGQQQPTDYGQQQPTDYGQQQPTDYGQQQPTDYGQQPSQFGKQPTEYSRQQHTDNQQVDSDVQVGFGQTTHPPQRTAFGSADHESEQFQPEPHPANGHGPIAAVDLSRSGNNSSFSQAAPPPSITSPFGLNAGPPQVR